MSNPAVVKLQEKTIDGKKIWLDDNFGEAIHIHIDDIRVDLTCREFEQLCYDVGEAVNELVNINGFNCHNIDPVYFEVMLAQELPNLKKIEKDSVFLEDLYAPTEKGILPLKKSREVKALYGDTSDNNWYRTSNHIGQSSQQRLDEILKSLKTHGYPYNEQCLILYGNDNVIRDGQHRAACLYYLYGNIKVPVLRYYFKGYKQESIGVSRIKLYRYLKKTWNYILRIRNINDIKRGIKICLRPILKIIEQFKIRLLIMKSKGKFNEAVKIINNK